MRLLDAIDRFQQLGITRSYRKMLVTQIDMLSQHIDALDGEAGAESSRHELKETKTKLEKQLQVPCGV